MCTNHIEIFFKTHISLESIKTCLIDQQFYFSLRFFFFAVKLDLSQNSIRRLSEKSFSTVQNTIEDLRLAGNLLGDTLNPIFSTTEFHGLTKLIRLDLSENWISSLEEGILKGCVNLEVKTYATAILIIPRNCINLNFVVIL